MSNYYNYDFESPSGIYALVKEELKSYFQTGAVDDLLFSIWTDRALGKLGKGMYKIKPRVLFLEDYETKLPPDFHSVREVWTCTSVTQRRRLPGSLYQSVTTNISNMYPYREVGACDTCDPCLPEEINVVYKTTGEEYTEKYRIQTLLKPGNIQVKSDCSLDCLNFYSSSNESFDIRDGKLITNFREGEIYMVYYAHEKDNEGYQMIPSNLRVKEYLEYYIKWKVFEMLSNQITDETYNQIESKKVYYKQMADEALINANIETKKQTIYKKFESIKRDMNRLSMFNIR